MATVADIVTGILVTELAADDDVIMNSVTNQRHLILKHFLFRKGQNKRKMIHNLGRIVARKKKSTTTRRRRYLANSANDGAGNQDHDYIDAVIPEFCADEFTEFTQHFNIQRSTFDKIVHMVTPKFGNMDKSTLPVERKVMIAMWLLSSQESFRSIAEKFGLQKSTTYYTFVWFISVLHSAAKNFIYWPDAESLSVIAGEFDRLYEFPGVVGVLNACQIPVKISPADENKDARAEPYSTVTLQAVCDHRMKFLDIFIGSPQPAHAVSCPWKFFEGSTLGTKLLLNEEEIPENCYLLGDGTYPLRTYLLTPYKENANGEASDDGDEVKKKFNAAHKAICKIIHRCFGLLRAKFSRLKYVDSSRYELIPQIITAACVLHNIILEEETGAEMASVAEDHDYNDEHVHPCPKADHLVDEDAILRRDVVASKIATQ